jgi:hypothetical protein
MSKNNNSAKVVRDQGLDKFYTNDDIVDICINSINKFHDINKFDLIIEPSAGNGSFLFKLPKDKRVGIDILPDNPEIIKKDFFDYIPSDSSKNILVIGNPPFGKVSSLAIKFFNHASKFSNFIAFIIPRTFRKISVQNKLNLNFHLKHDEDIPLNPCSFTPPMMVKCCFQIWQKSDVQRNIIKLPTVHPHWTFLSYGPKDKNNQPTPPQNADFALRAYGGKCGDIITENLQDLRPKSWHWIKCNIDKDKLINRFKQLDYTNSLNTARQNSIGRAELVSLYSDFLFTNFEL